MKRDKQKLPMAFHGDTGYYQRDWQGYYSAITRLVRPNSSVLDVGCGNGGLSLYLQEKMGCRVVGLDVSEEAITACKAKGIKTVKCDIEEEEIPGTYEVIVLSAIMEHLIDPAAVLRKLRDNLVNSGDFIVGVPNSLHILARLSYLRGKNIKRFGNSKEDFKLGGQPLDHIQVFSKSSLSLLLRKNLFAPVEWSYAKYSTWPFSGPFPVMILSWMAFKVQAINRPLFSPFIAVRARKI